MPSTAISSQGTTLSIASTAGAGKPITGISLANPCVVTSVAHGLAKGDIGAFAAIVGTTQLNGTSQIVQYTSPNTFSLAGVDSAGYTPWTSGGTFTPSLFQAIGNIKTFSGFDGSATELDVSNLQSLAKEYRLGLQDPGQFTIEVDQDAADLGQMSLLAHQASGAISTFKLVLPSGSTATFSAFVKKVSSSGGVDSVVKRSVDLRISGNIVWS